MTCCIICLEDIHNSYIPYNRCYMCNNILCNVCSNNMKSNDSMRKRYYVTDINDNLIGFGECSTMCIETYVIKIGPYSRMSLFSHEVMENQHNIHISTLLPKHLNNYIINDLTNIVIDFLVE